MALLLERLKIFEHPSRIIGGEIGRRRPIRQLRIPVLLLPTGNMGGRD
jgi:hypothetical protein